ncbi:MAG: taurine ABC transporter substrate-binding protein [Nitrospinota bacterium]|nr:MAG: taurine ABC transporter substrate-binding protein [Nitrospinota bacterium]
MQWGKVVLWSFLLVFALTAVVVAEPLRIAMSTWVGYGPLHLAKAKGFYAEEGVEVKLITMEEPTPRFAALAAGRLDGLASTIDTMILQSKKEIPYVMVLALDDSAGGDGIVANKEIKSIADLKGKKVAFNLGSVSQFWVNVLLQQHGLKESDITVVNMSAPDAGAAFVAKKVDAAVTWEPWLTRGKQAPHGHLLIDSSQTPGLIVDILIFRKDVVEKRSADIQKVVNAWFRAVDFWKQHPQEANTLMAKAVGGWLKDPKVFAETLQGVKLLGREENRKFFGTKENPGPIFTTAAKAIQIWKDFGKLSWEPKPEEIIETKFVQ